MQARVSTTEIASDHHAHGNCLTCTSVHAQAGLEALSEVETGAVKAGAEGEGVSAENAERAPLDEGKAWYVLRDLRRTNCRMRGYDALADRGVEVYTPMKWVVESRSVGGRERRERRLRPVISDLLFVRGREEELKPVVADAGNLIFRFVRGAYMKAMTVSDVEMERFIRATKLSDNPQYYELSELTPDMLGRTVRITDGPLEGCTGKLLKIRGARTKRVVISIPELLAVGVEVSEGMFEVLEG